MSEVRRQPEEFEIEYLNSGYKIHVIVHFDASCLACNKNAILKDLRTRLGKKFDVRNTSDQNQLALYKKLSSKKPYPIYVNCSSGCNLSDQSYFDTPEHIDGTYTLINLGPMSVGE